MYGLVFFFVALAEVHWCRLSFHGNKIQQLVELELIGHCCVCSSLLFASELHCDSPRYSKQRMNKISPSRSQTSSNQLCCVETQNVRWRLLEFIYDLLLATAATKKIYTYKTRDSVSLNDPARSTRDGNFHNIINSFVSLSQPVRQVSLQTGKALLHCLPPSWPFISLKSNSKSKSKQKRQSRRYFI